VPRVKAEADTESKTLPGTGVEAETWPPSIELEVTVRDVEGVTGSSTPNLFFVDMTMKSPNVAVRGIGRPRDLTGV
jgi:hypothetical protein